MNLDLSIFLVLSKLEFLFPWFLFLVFLTKAICFRCFYMRQNQTVLLGIGQYFLTKYFMAFDFNVSSNLNSNPNTLIEIFSIRAFLSID